MSRIFLGALLAVGLSSTAFAETQDSASSLELGELTLTTQLDLDRQFERSHAHAADGRLHGMAGPSSMTCSPGLTASELDTCVVTADGTPRLAVPAAIAAN